MKIPLRKALWLAVGPANVDAAGHAVADWFDGHNCSGAADLIREQLQDQPVPDAVPHDRPDTSLRAELLQKLATHREVLLNLCNRVDRLEMRADGLSPIERVQRRWAKERSVKESLTVGGNGPAVSDGREPAAVVGEPSDAELLELMPEQFRVDLATVSLLAARDAGTGVTPGLFRVSLNTGALEYARAVWDRARQGHQPAPPAEGEVGKLVAWLRKNAEDECQMCGSGQASLNFDRAAELLQQRHPEPVPVSERLPGPEDMTEDGQVWIAYPGQKYPLGDTGCWENPHKWLLRPIGKFDLHWLPATALPLPAGEG